MKSTKKHSPRRDNSEQHNWDSAAEDAPARHARQPGAIDDPVVAARERRRERRRKQRSGGNALRYWRNVLVLAVCCCASLLFLFMITESYTHYRFWQGQVDAKEAQLRDLQKQHQLAQNRLAMLDNDKGRAQILIERGYVRPGERILLFPESPGAPASEPERVTNDLAPHPPLHAVQPQRAGSAWQRAANSIRNWWQNVRGAETKPQPAAPAP